MINDFLSNNTTNTLVCQLIFMIVLFMIFQATSFISDLLWSCKRLCQFSPRQCHRADVNWTWTQFCVNYSQKKFNWKTEQILLYEIVSWKCRKKEIMQRNDWIIFFVMNNCIALHFLNLWINTIFYIRNFCFQGDNHLKKIIQVL